MHSGHDRTRHIPISTSQQLCGNPLQRLDNRAVRNCGQHYQDQHARHDVDAGGKILSDSKLFVGDIAETLGDIAETLLDETLLAHVAETLLDGIQSCYNSSVTSAFDGGESSDRTNELNRLSV